MDITNFKKVISLSLVLTFAGTQELPAAFTQTLFPSSVSTQSLNINQLTIPGNIASLEERFMSTKGTDGITVIAIQDAHGIFDAQQNIRALIQELQDSYGFELMGLEGGEGRANHTLLRAFPDPEMNRKVAEEYMRRAELSGGEAAAILNPRPGIFYGIENRELYFQNRNSFLRALEKKDANLHTLDLLQKKMDKTRDQIFPLELLKFHKAEQKYLTGRMALWEYVDILGEEAGKQGTLLDEKYPNIVRLFQAMAAARKRPAKTAEAAKQAEEALTSQIQGRVLFEEIKNLSDDIIASLSFPRKRESSDFKPLKDKSLDSRWSLPSSVLIGGGNDSIPVLLDLYRHLEILRNLASLSSTRDDWDFYLAHKKDFEFGQFQNFLAGYQETIDLGLDLEPAENFYEDAARRDQALYENLIAAMKKEGKTRAVVVAGGFHTSGLGQRMKKDEISYAVYTPKMEHIESENSYYKVMEGDVSWKRTNQFSIQINLPTMGLEPDAAEFYDDYARRYAQATGQPLSNPRERATENILQALKDAFTDTLTTELNQPTKVLPTQAASIGTSIDTLPLPVTIIEKIRVGLGITRAEELSEFSKEDLLVKCEFSSGQWKEIRRALKKKKIILKPSPKRLNKLGGIHALELGGLTLSALKRNKIYTIRDITALSADQLRIKSRIGPAMIQEVQDALARWKFKLVPSSEDWRHAGPSGTVVSQARSLGIERLPDDQILEFTPEEIGTLYLSQPDSQHVPPELEFVLGDDGKLVLIVVQGTDIRNVYPFSPGQSMLIGRSDIAEVLILHSHVSAEHLRVEWTVDGKIKLYTLHSKNGTYRAKANASSLGSTVPSRIRRLLLGLAAGGVMAFVCGGCVSSVQPAPQKPEPPTAPVKTPATHLMDAFMQRLFVSDSSEGAWLAFEVLVKEHPEKVTKEFMLKLMDTMKGYPNLRLAAGSAWRFIVQNQPEKVNEIIDLILLRLENEDWFTRDAAIYSLDVIVSAQDK
ncbi:MAG: FHA domain-containing protein, partial [Candidatus Omnitrophica bacterium]|nr:FHA domain-containing protein [Candidatus Omnitrophota bacterium]